MKSLFVCPVVLIVLGLVPCGWSEDHPPQQASPSAAAPALDYVALVTSLASRNSAPRIERKPRIADEDVQCTVFLKNFYWEEQTRVEKVISLLHTEIDQAWPVLWAMRNDARYCITVQYREINNNVHNFSVGDVCTQLLQNALCAPLQDDEIVNNDYIG